MMRKQANRYASQPQINVQGGGGGAPLGQMGGFAPLGMGNNLNQAAHAAQVRPNPAAKPVMPKPIAADAAGIQQAMQKMGFGARNTWLEQAIMGLLTSQKSAEVQVSSGSSGGSGSAQPAQKRNMVSAGGSLSGIGGNAGQTGAAGQSNFAAMGQQNSGMGMGIGGFGVVGGMMGGLYGNGGAKSGLNLGPHTSSPMPVTQKSAAAPVPGPASMPPTPGAGTMVPPPPPPSPAMAAGGMPPQDPAAMGMPPPPGAMPPGDPAAMGGMPPPPPGIIDPMTGQPQVAPMATPPPPPLPANPVPPQVKPKTSGQAQQEANMLGLLESKESPQGGQEAIQSDLMGAGVKSGVDVWAFASTLSKSGIEKRSAGEQQHDMKGWHYKVLQNEKHEGEEKWMPRGFTTETTPLNELLASPGKQGLLGGLAGGAVGALGGSQVNKLLPTGQADWKNALIGGGLGALAGGIGVYGHRRKKNDDVIDALRRLAPGATVGDYGKLKTGSDSQYIDPVKASIGGAGAGGLGGFLNSFKTAWRPGFKPSRNNLAMLALNSLIGGAGLGVASGLGSVTANNVAHRLKSGLDNGLEKSAVDIVLNDGTNLGDHEKLGQHLAEKLHATVDDGPSRLLHDAMLTHLNKLAAQEKTGTVMSMGINSAPRSVGPLNLQSRTQLSLPLSLSNGPPATPAPAPTVKSGAQRPDGKLSPARSATGESTLSYNHKPDDYAQGQAAWAATDKYFKGSKKKQPNPFTGDHIGKVASDITPFAQGFLSHCEAMNLTMAQVKQAMVKVAQEYPEGLGELRDALEKVAWGQALWNTGKGLWQGAKALGSRAAAAPVIKPALNVANKAGLGQSALGGVSGYFAGSDENGGSWGTAAAGAAAANPWARKLAGRPGVGSLAAVPMRATQGYIAGGMGGWGLDMASHHAGLEGTRFQQLGRTVGGAAGGVAGTGHAMKGIGLTMRQPGALTGVGAPGPMGYSSYAPGRSTLTPMGANLVNWGNKVKQFGAGAVSPIEQPIRSLGRAAGILPAAGKATPMMGLGKGVGALGLGVLGVREGIEGAKNTFANTGRDLADSYMNSRVPEWMGMVRDQADDYMNQRGMLDQQGKFNPLGGALKNFGGNMMGHADQLFRQLGMNPEQMSPAQKAMLIGGVGTGGIGALTGNPLMMGAGGASTMAGMLPFLRQQQGQGQGQGQGQPFNMPNMPGARNEWDNMRQLQQQQQG